MLRLTSWADPVAEAPLPLPAVPVPAGLLVLEVELVQPARITPANAITPIVIVLCLCRRKIGMDTSLALLARLPVCHRVRYRMPLGM
jgi:hypothetical protein